MRLGALLLIVVMLAACSVPPSPPPVPVVIDTTNVGFDGAYARGFGWRRTFDGAWAALEPERARFDWRAMDRVVNEAQANGQKLLWLCWVMPAWAANDWRRFVPENRDDLVRFLEAFWDRYAEIGVIGAVEVWGEPNHQRTGRPEDPAEYVALLRIVHDVTRRKAPGVKVVGAGMSSGWWEPWLRDIFRLGALDWVDAVTISRYKELSDSDPSAERALVGSLGALRRVMAQYGRIRPIWITEAGVGHVPREGGDPPSQATVNANYEARGVRAWEPWRLRDGTWRSVSEQRAAATMVKANVQGLAHGVERIFWFREHYPQEDHFSWFLDGQISAPTLLVRAHEVLAGLIDPGVELSVIAEALDLGDGTDLYVYQFRRDQMCWAVAWRQARTRRAWPLLWSAPLPARPVRFAMSGQAAELQAQSMLGETLSVVASEQEIRVDVGEDPVYVSLGSGGSLWPIQVAPTRPHR